MSSNRSRLVSLTLCAVFAMLAESVFASHFRYGYMFWERDLTYSNNTSPNLVRVKVTVEAGLRWTYPSHLTATVPGYTNPPRSSDFNVACAGVVTTSTDMGATSCPPLNLMVSIAGAANNLLGIDASYGSVAVEDFLGNPVPVGFNNFFNPVTGTTTHGIGFNAIVQQIVPTQDTVYARMVFYLVFDRSVKPKIVWANTNRILPLLDGNGDRPWQLSTTIDVSSANAGVTKSPQTSSPAVIQVFTGQDNIVPLPSVTFDNLVPKWRLAEPTESGLIKKSPQAPSEFELNEDTGVVTFKPGANGFYGVQFVLTAYDNSTTPPTPKASVPLDLLFQAVTPTATVTSTLATGDGQTNYTATVPNPFSFQVKSTTAPADSQYRVTINHGALPPGATFTQPTCFGDSVCTGTFNWTPTVNSTSSVVCFTSTVTFSLTLVATSPSMCVTVGLAPLVTTLIVDPASGASGGGPVTLRARLTRQLDNAPLNSRPVTFTFDASPGNPPWIGNATVLTDINGVAEANLTLIRTVNPPSPFTATFNAVAGEFVASSSASNVLSSLVATTSLNAPIIAPSPLPSVGFPTPASAVLNRIYTDGGIYGVAQDGVTFTVTPPAGGGSPSTVNGGTTNALGVSQVNLPAPAVTGTHSVSAFFPGNANLLGPASSSATTYQVYQRTQLTTSAGVASVNVASPVTAVLVAIPSNTPLGGKQVTFSTPGLTSQTVTTDANGVATAVFTFTSLGQKVVTASYTPAAGAELNRNGLAANETSAANIEVQPAQITTTTLAPFTGISGQESTLSAHVEVTSSSAPISGGTVTFAIVGGGTIGAGTTDANGDVTVAFTPGAAVSGTYSASFAGTPGFAPSSATNTLTISKASTALAPLATNLIDSVGEPLTVSTTLTRTTAPAGAVSGATVVFTLIAPGGSVSTQSAQTDAAGDVSVSFPPFSVRGEHSVSASFAGNGSLLPASSGSATVTVYQRTSLSVSPVNSLAGATTSVAATLLAQPSGAAISGQVVEFSFGAAGIPDQNAVTDATGRAEVFVNFANAGSYPVTAMFFNPAAFYVDHIGDPQTTVGNATATIGLASTALAALTAPGASMVDSAITVSTVLTRTATPVGPAGGETVMFTVHDAGGSTTLSGSAVTNASGVASYTFTPTTRGVHTVAAQFAAGPALEASTSNTVTVSVYQRTALTFPPMMTASAAKPAAVSATLTRVPGSGPIAGQTVMFHFSGPGAPTQEQATTDASGVATVTVTFASPVVYDVEAVFGNAADFYADSTGAFPIVQTIVRSTIDVTNTPPAWVQVENMTLEATGSSGATATFTESGTDTEDGLIAAVCTPASGTTFAIGTTTVSCTVTDVAQAQDGGTFTVTVEDTTAPVLTLPTVASAAATSSAGRTVNYTATALDIVDGATAVTCSPASDSWFPIGTTTVNCSTTDAHGNDASGSFDVTTTNTAPTIVDLPNLSGEATGPSGLAFSFTSNGNDAEQGALTPTCNYGSGTFPLGDTIVTCTVTDFGGLTASDSFTVTVVDTTKPVLTLPADITVDPVNAGGAPVTFTVSATDIVTFPLSPACSPVSGSTFVIGTTTVNCTVTDGAGNTQTGAFTVTVRNPTQAAQNLQTTIEAVLPQASSNIDNAVKFIGPPSQGSLNAACNNLNSVIQKANQNQGLTAAQRLQIITAANNLKATIGCTP
jgi:hypothetical protein